MIQFKKVKTSAIDGIEVDSGMLLKNFNIAKPSTPTDEDILGITSGGFTFTANADYEDFGADIDNVPNGSKEFKRRTAWHVSLTTNLLDQNVDNIKFALGAKSYIPGAQSGEDADGDHFTMHSITPSKNLKSSDFQNLYATFNLLDGISWVIIEIENALSTGGYQLTTSKNGKGQTAITIEGHPTIEAGQYYAPFTIYWGTLVHENEASAETGTGGTGTGG